MKNRLPGISSVIYDQAVSSRVKPLQFGKVPCNKEQVSYELLVPFFHVLYIRDMLLGHDQDVGGRLRIDVFECNCHFIAVYKLRRDPVFNDLAEKAA